ncbi:glycosyltransferase [Candidatus Riflebacteria bacterium]
MWSKTKNVLFIIYSLEIGGAERVMLELIKKSPQTHYKVHLVLLEKKGDFLKYLPEWIKIRGLGLQKKNPLTWARAFFRLRRILRNLKPVKIVSFLSNVNIFSYFSNLGFNFPHLCSERISPEFYNDSKEFFKRPVYRLYLKILPQIYKKINVLVVQNSEIANKWQKLNVPSHLIRILPNGFDLKGIVAQSKKARLLDFPDKFNLVTLARLHPQKNPFIALKVLKILKDKDIFWTWLGGGPLMSQLQKMVKKEGLSKNIRFVGSVSNPYPLLARADLFVLPSNYEGFPNALVEAIALSVPVLVSDCPTGPAEILQHGKYGFLVPKNDPYALAQSIVNCKNQREQERINLTQRARKSIERFDVNVVYSLWWDLILKR